MTRLLHPITLAAAVVFAVALAGPTANTAQAASIDLGVLDPGETIDFGSSIQNPGTFNDTFTFSLESSATLSIDASSLLFAPFGSPLIGIENLSLDLFQVDPLPVSFIAGFTAGNPGSGGALVDLMLDAGTYFFHMSGEAIGAPGAVGPSFDVASGIYAGEIAVVPLPPAAMLFLSAIACVFGVSQLRRRWNPQSGAKAGS